MILIFMGPPGAGKGTQSKLVEVEKGLVQISTGDILRAAVQNQTKLGLEAKAFMDKGDLVPDSVVIGIIKERIQESDCKNGFILDGFPRTSQQAQALDEILASLKLKLDHVINFEVPDIELVNRLLSRAQLEGRADDNAASIENRLKVFKEKTQPLIDYYQNKGILKGINGLGTVEDISAKVRLAIS